MNKNRSPHSCNVRIIYALIVLYMYIYIHGIRHVHYIHCTVHRTILRCMLIYCWAQASSYIEFIIRAAVCMCVCVCVCVCVFVRVYVRKYQYSYRAHNTSHIGPCRQEHLSSVWTMLYNNRPGRSQDTNYHTHSHTHTYAHTHTHTHTHTGEHACI